MADSLKRTVRKGRIVHLKVANIAYRTFIWQTGTSFSGRVEGHPHVEECRARTEDAVREQLRLALTASLKT